MRAAIIGTTFLLVGLQFLGPADRSAQAESPAAIVPAVLATVAPGRIGFNDVITVIMADGTQISARVTEVRPNGDLALEAHRTVANNGEVQKHSFTGIVQPEDVLPNRTVASKKVAELNC